MSNSFMPPILQAAAIIMESTGENDADQNLFSSSVADDSNTETKIKRNRKWNKDQSIHLLELFRLIVLTVNTAAYVE